MLLVAPTGDQASHSHAFITSGNTSVWLMWGTISGLPEHPVVLSTPNRLDLDVRSGAWRRPPGVASHACGRYNVPQ